VKAVPDDETEAMPKPRLCPKCGTDRFRIVGTSPAVTYFRCDACEHVSAVRK
jgi:predicted  nucleic acid-binding Zn ribbon protein